MNRIDTELTTSLLRHAMVSRRARFATQTFTAQVLKQRKLRLARRAIRANADWAIRWMPLV